VAVVQGRIRQYAADQPAMLVVGAGFTGCTIARTLADAGRRVTIIDKRSHIGGNAYDYYDEDGVLIHKYGPHGFHTNSERIFNFISRFTEWRDYPLRVLAFVENKLVPFPINCTTLHMLYGIEPTEAAAGAYLANARTYCEYVSSSYDVLTESVGPVLAKVFYEGYTKKQWGLDLWQLEPSVAARIAVRTTADDRYHTDTYQGVPLHGYTKMFENMVDHKNIKLELNMPYDPAMRHYFTFWTGPIDEFYNHKFGPLPYRSLRFERIHYKDVEYAQPVAQINYPDVNVPYTRVLEYKHMTGQKCPGTTLIREYPEAEGDPFYPIPRTINQELYKKYHRLSERESDVIFAGRLAQYRYYNMDQAVGAGIAAAERILG